LPAERWSTSAAAAPLGADCQGVSGRPPRTAASRRRRP
jgi:hypothetical protein